ncbi:extracellular mutant protein 11-domain-containing protein [Boeremia exigua]|uniref:extracellular mutant protein 11-domain-containing protein n=1 Tax=Boeremia exigua TaxID=749465 RepID=UPI001E8DA3CC|nr:extracellular mutant protein 11-domain-containing protein [Boeremia exigua]KAH6612014.1 extracellular mutant protein 11-domain-containing protein [Boeremia exigua]
MSGLQNFVRGNRNGQAGGPQSGQLPVNRQRVAANAKVPMKPHIARPPTSREPDVHDDILSQPPSVSAQQQQLQQGPSGEGRKSNAWDTDTGSIDTTVNQSVIQAEDSQQQGYRSLPPASEESGDGEDEASGLKDVDEDDVDFSEEVENYLTAHDLGDATRAAQMHFLQTTQPQLFPTIDGDSYPTTTDGNPTEWDEQHEHFADLDSSPRPSEPRFQQGFDATILNQQPLQSAALHAPHANPVLLPNNVWSHGAQIREQRRADNAVQGREQPVQHQDPAHEPTSQPPTYSQATVQQQSAVPSALLAQSGSMVQVNPTGLQQRSSRLPVEPEYGHNQVPRIVEPAHASRHLSTTHAQVVPVVQQPVQSALVGAPDFPDTDYDPEVLSRMNYEQLANETFDTNPRKGDSDLPGNIREKPLPERLQFVQRELNPNAQSDFFSGLSTREWEDAGDWFLDQFSAIIKRTREARQKKRNKAQDFEEEIEKHHQHVAKKQRLVESAMAKMQAQGEGLVPKSPRASKSPQPRRG